MLLADLDSLTIMQLRQKYRGEATAHSNMMARAKTKGASIHPAFRAFKDFLRHVGPKPTKKATLDRIDNNDPEYAPGKVRWADKKTQNANKGDSVIFHCAVTGRYFKPGQLAARQKITPAAIRKRRSDGWTDAEIIAGSRQVQKPIAPPKSRPSPVSAYRPPMSAAEVLFMRNREACEHYKRETGEEYFVTTPAEFYETLGQDAVRFCGGPEWIQYAEALFLKHKLPSWWKEFKPHINFLALKPFQQEWILRIDPDQANKLKMAASL
ncbi:MAG: hypothetical protein JNM13_03325 [Hyphomicrobiaceae bacterium]|nr:hypothetical protein [Hyphomicrobiaceae bacterium]